MNSTHLRLVVFALNTGLLLGVVQLGIGAYRSAPVEVPDGFDPVALALEGEVAGREDMAPVWRALDRPLPKVEPPPPPTRAEAERWRLVLAILDPERPEQGASIVEGPGGVQFSLAVGGDPVQGMTLERVEVSDVEGGRETIATLRGPDAQAHLLRLERK